MLNNKQIKNSIFDNIWKIFCDGLKRAGEDIILLHQNPKTYLNQIEGYRYLSRLTRAALEAFIELSHNTNPVLRRPVHETIKMGMDNPDNIYLISPINNKYQYCINGKRNNIFYVGFGIQSGGYGKTGSLDTIGFLNDHNIFIDNKNKYEIIVSSNKPHNCKNWIQILENSSIIQVRQTRQNHNNEIVSQVIINRINNKNFFPIFNPLHISNALKSSMFFINATIKLFRQWSENFRKYPNKLPRFNPKKAIEAGGDPNIAYYHSIFNIQIKQGLLIQFTPYNCGFWNFQLGNYWLESLDYCNFTIHINKYNSINQQNKKINIVIASQKLSLLRLKKTNWLNTQGRLNGTMCFRWIGSKKYSNPKCEIINFNNKI